MAFSSEQNKSLRTRYSHAVEVVENKPIITKCTILGIGQNFE